MSDTPVAILVMLVMCLIAILLYIGAMYLEMTYGVAKEVAVVVIGGYIIGALWYVSKKVKR